MSTARLRSPDFGCAAASIKRQDVLVQAEVVGKTVVVVIACSHSQSTKAMIWHSGMPISKAYSSELWYLCHMELFGRLDESEEYKGPLRRSKTPGPSHAPETLEEVHLPGRSILRVPSAYRI
jgi:hypothetical protein